MVKSLANALAHWPPIVAALDFLDRRNENRMGELGMISQAFHFAAINKIDGDYFEFGLWRGKTFTYAHRMKQRHGFQDMTLWGFDSFRGLPDASAERDGGWQTGEFSCSEEEFRQILKQHRIRPEEYRLISGYYDRSLNGELHRRLEGRSAAVVYVDCDLYSSTSQVLQFLPRYLTNGTIICFDDYYCYKAAPDQGEQKAIAEFLATNPDIRLIPYFDYAPLGKSFIVRTNVKPNV